MTPGFIAPAMPNGTCTHASASIAFGWSRFPCAAFHAAVVKPCGSKFRESSVVVPLSLAAYACSK